MRFFLFGLAFFFAATPFAMADFFDVPESHPQKEAIYFLEEKGVADGRVLFNPREIATRETFLVMALLASDKKPEGSPAATRFLDVPKESYLSSYVALADALGALYLFEDDVFLPAKAITRKEAAVIAAQLFGASPDADLLEHADVFFDVDAKSPGSLLLMFADQHNAFGPTGRHLRPGSPLSRAETAQLLFAFDGASSEKLTLTIGGPESHLDPDGLLDAAWYHLEEYFLHGESMNRKDQLHGALSGMVDSLGDPYTNYLPPADSENFSRQLDGEVEGIGAYLQENEAGQVVIVAPIEGSPAQKAGLRPGDIIKAVDGKDIGGFSTEEAARIIKGPAGTSVTLTLLRNDTLIDITITRAKVDIPSLEHETLSPGTLLVRLYTFGTNTAADLSPATTGNGS